MLWEHQEDTYLEESEIVRTIGKNGCTIINVNCQACPLNKLCKTHANHTPAALANIYFNQKARARIKIWKDMK